MAIGSIEIRGVRDATPETIPEELQAGVVHLWQRSLHGSEKDISACYELLLPEEREKASRYRVERPRGDYILTRGTLRALLSRYLDTNPQAITFEYTEYGKPFLKNAVLRFNVSHTEGLALMAFALNREVGVDVEKVRVQADALKISERFFSMNERDILRPMPESELHTAFFRCWTRKEAYIKAKGEGLSLPLHQFDVSLDADPVQGLIATRPDAEEAARWTIRNVKVETGYAAAIAVGEEIR